MSTNGRPSMAKRQKEMARQEKQREKAVKRGQRASTPRDPAASGDDGLEIVLDAQGNPVLDADGNLTFVSVRPDGTRVAVPSATTPTNPTAADAPGSTA